MDKNDKMPLYKGDTGRVFDFYNGNYEKYGYSVKSLAWIKGKQNIRFDALTRFLDMNRHFSILDIGCGFGDINKFFHRKSIFDYTYHGIDLVEGMIIKANEIYENDENITFSCGDFLTSYQNDDVERYDYIIASGIFNFQMDEIGNYDNVNNIMKKALDLCRPKGAISFDFQSDKVDFFSDNGVSFYNSPEKILSIAYKYSRNVILSNLYMPFEFSVTLFKDDSFDGNNLVFHKFMEDHKIDFDEGVFHEE